MMKFGQICLKTAEMSLASLPENVAERRSWVETQLGSYPSLLSLSPITTKKHSTTTSNTHYRL